MKNNNVSFKQNFPPKSCVNFASLKKLTIIISHIQLKPKNREFKFNKPSRALVSVSIISYCVNVIKHSNKVYDAKKQVRKCQKNISQNIITLNNIEDLYKNESKSQWRVSQKEIHSCKSKENQIKNDPQLNAIFNINNINSLHRDHILLINIIRSGELDHSIRNE